ncbi:hypothetical protein T492DRAFT_1016009 [Pavlovales sp. CCMP2436]|nr:hypothetical protein T492DRAFT_1016009 [Pavlovales sp. CCMP2436]
MPLDPLPSWVTRLRASTSDLFVADIFKAWSQLRFARAPFQLCVPPRPSAHVLRLEKLLERGLRERGLAQDYACLHWRVGRKFGHAGAEAARALARLTLRYVRALAARGVHVRSLLLLTQLMNHAKVAFRAELRRLAPQLTLVSPWDVYAASPEIFTDPVANFDATIAEKRLCARAHTFIASAHSTFSAHIDGLRAMSGMPTESTVWVSSACGERVTSANLTSDCLEVPVVRQR